MKITFVGTGTMGSVNRCNTSILVDNILFDIGMGTVKQVERLKIYTKSINYVVISHFHADHFLDIPNLLFGSFTHSDGNIHKYDKIEEKYNMEFVELQNEEQYITDKFKLTALELKHGNCVPMNGYVLEKDENVISYACDTAFCDNYFKMCEVSNYMLSDVTGLKTTDMHIGLEDYRQLCKKYPNCAFYAVHRSDYDIYESNDVKFPNDGEILNI